MSNEGKRIVLVGGCFDILHIGHITFLEKAKAEGDILVVLLESDESIRKNKGSNRPINTQEDRAKILSALKSVDLVIRLPLMESNQEYDDLVAKIQPDIIASAYGDKAISHKRRQAQKLGIELKIVMKVLKDKSTTNLIKLLGYS
ncbi:MAG: D-beta-D-heptose 7-phosphate kinase / D-beta-D-heptose 1-phosphate adenosyltransferase [Microgenomates group bacterium Gr01-1014_80]|nr:MAG: D-beta-D-heptose 7-phosphate kinase / D-beta-D-heptose 1-phosphate adenosyltransferase [Microgenomates group bacterium Gr01-1014_80]